MIKKKKQSRSQSSTKKSLEPFSDSSPSPRLLSIIRSKLVSGKDMKHMFRGMRSKTVPGLSSQSRIVRCPKCHKLLQEPLDATSYKCGGCDSILQAKSWELEGNDNKNTIPEALYSSQNRSLSTQAESAEGGRKTPMRSTQREYNSEASPSVDRGYHSETVYKHEISDTRREWMRRADAFSGTGDSDAFASARSSPYNSRSNASQWTQHDGRYEDPPRVPFYPASPSPSSAYEYGYSSPFHGSHVSASEQSYYHHRPNQFKQYGREGWLQESSSTSPAHFSADVNYYHRSSQSQLHDLQYHNLYEPRSSATPHRFVYSERNYQAAAAPHRSTYSEHSVESSKSETISEKSSQGDKKGYVRERNLVVKRHILPSAGGAPFATCSYCLELLQIPQMSPHGKHKRYQVRCGSCSGVLKFSIRGKADSVLDSPSFVNSGMGFAEETVTDHQDYEESYPDGSHLPCLDDDFGNPVCQNTNDVISSQSLETFGDKGIEKDIRNISSKKFDLKSEALSPRLKSLVNNTLREKQPASNETIGETSGIRLEQSQEAHSEKSTEIDNNNISEKIGYNSEESENEKNDIIKPEEIVGEGSGEFLEVPVNTKERMRQSCEEVERVVERPVYHSVEPLYKNVYACETRIPTEETRNTHEFDWEESQKNEEFEGETTWEEIMGDKPGLLLEKSRYIGDFICDSSSSYGENFEDAAAEEGTKHIENAISAKPQSPLKSLVNENPRFIGHPEQSGEATFTISRIYEEQSKYEYENLRERKGLDKTTSDRVRYEVESRYETNETLEPGKVGEGAYVVSLEKVSKTFKTTIQGEAGEERLVSQNVDSPVENFENSCETLEPVYLEGSGYAGERTWEETMGDRAGLHLEEYERNYENYNKPFEWTSERASTSGMHDYELGAMRESDEDADEISESSSRGSFNNHGSSEERDGLPESQDAKPDQALYKHESSSERQDLSNTVFEIVRSDLQEFKYETDETLVPSKMVEDGSVVSVEKASVTIISEICEESLVSHQLEPENVDIENSYETVEPVYLEGSRCESENPWAETPGDGGGLKLEVYNRNPFEWTSERAPTFHLHEYELGTEPEPEEDANIRLNEIAVYHEEEPWLVEENKNEALQLEKCENESMKLEEAHEWTSERAPTFRLREYELGAMLESDYDADGRSDSNSRNSFCDHRISKEREFFDEEEPQLVIDGRTEELQVGEIAKNIVSLNLEERGNESLKLDAFEWTAGRTLTFRRHGCEVGTKLEPDEDADGKSESSSRGSFIDRESSRKIAVTHEDEPWLVDDYETDALKVGVMAEDGPSLHLEKCDNERMELDETLELRDDIFRLSLDDTFEQERMTFHSKMSQDKQDHLRLSFKQGEAEEDMPALSSRVSSKSHESPSKMAEFNSSAEEKILKDHLEHLQEENEKSGLTSESYAHIYSTTKPSEIVGLRHALYQTQNSPLRSPLTSPIRTPVGSPLHYTMASRIRSPVASPVHSHIVSPLRSPINSSGSLSDVLFFGNKG